MIPSFPSAQIKDVPQPHSDQYNPFQTVADSDHPQIKLTKSQ